MKHFITGGITFLLLLVVFVVWRFMYGEVFSDAVRVRLKPGMTTNEVISILGPPSWMTSRQWEYTRPLMFNGGLVFFDDSGHFTQAIND